MTKKKKQERIQEFIKIITSFGFKEDRWGNFKIENKGRKLRFKIKKINIRFEININPWLKIFSKKIVNFSPDQLKEELTKRGFKENVA